MEPPEPIPGAAFIALNDGTWAIIDEDVYERVSKHSWKAQDDRVLSTQAGLLHRFVLDLQTGDPEVDHRNGDARDNRRQNLRIATSQQNKANTRRKGSAPYKGISLDRRDGRWAAYLTVDYKRKSLGRFGTADEAARAYDEAARAAFGQFACVNFPQEGERSAS